MRARGGSTPRSGHRRPMPVCLVAALSILLPSQLAGAAPEPQGADEPAPGVAGAVAQSSVDAPPSREATDREPDLRFDWELREEPAGPLVTWARGARDGLVGIVDAVGDLQIGVFSEVALDVATVLMAGSDLVGVIDDNAISQHVLRGVVSKGLARTAYLLHAAGADAIRGSHGLEREWYLEEGLADLNPLLAGESVGPAIPLDPLAFLGEAYCHDEVYAARLPGPIAGASLAADLLLRPAAGFARIAGQVDAADAIDARARALVKAAIP